MENKFESIIRGRENLMESKGNDSIIQFLEDIEDWCYEEYDPEEFGYSFGEEAEEIYSKNLNNEDVINTVECDPLGVRDFVKFLESGKLPKFSKSKEYHFEGDYTEHNDSYVTVYKSSVGNFIHIFNEPEMGECIDVVLFNVSTKDNLLKFLKGKSESKRLKESNDYEGLDISPFKSAEDMDLEIDYYLADINNFENGEEPLVYEEDDEEGNGIIAGIGVYAMNDKIEFVALCNKDFECFLQVNKYFDDFKSALNFGKKVVKSKNPVKFIEDNKSLFDEII